MGRADWTRIGHLLETTHRLQPKKLSLIETAFFYVPDLMMGENKDFI
jgi:hypothetical protein